MINGRRVATASGAILAGAALLDAALLVAARGGDSCSPEPLFEPQFWAGHGDISPVGGGRGSAWFIDHGNERWVLRHYRRGGFTGRLCEDRYLWTGEARVRAFAEYRLLAAGSAWLAGARAGGRALSTAGLGYRCDLITRRIAGTAP